MNAAAAALQGPLQLCNIKAKLNRWRESIRSAVQDDIDAGLWPAQVGTDGGYAYELHFTHFRDTVVPQMIEAYRQTVSCASGGSAYSPADWGELYSSPIGKMLETSRLGLPTGSWDASWTTACVDVGGDGGVFVGLGLGAGALVMLVGLAACLYVRKGKSTNTAGESDLEISSITAIPSTTSSDVPTSALQPSAGPSELVLVTVPSGVSGGQDMLVSAPAGGVLIVRVPSNCTQYTVSVPRGAPVSRNVSVSVLPDSTLKLDYAPAAVGGVQVTKVFPGSVADLAGIKKGERIVAVGGQPITSADVCAQMLAGGSGGTLVLQITGWVPEVQVFS